MKAKDFKFDSQTKKPFDATTLGIIKNTITGIPKATKKVAGDILYGITRNLGSAGLTLTGQEEIKPTTPFEEKAFNFIYGGKEPVKNLQNRVLDSETKIKQSTFAQKYGLDKYSLPLAFAGVMGSVGLDVTPFGGVEKNAVKAIAKETSESGIVKILSKMKVEDDVIKEFAPKLAKTSSEKEVVEALDIIKKTQTVKNLSSTVDNILETEAKKYRSAGKGLEEFEMRETRGLFHATDDFSASSIEKQGFTLGNESVSKLGAKDKSLGEGIYFGKSRSAVSQYGDSVVEARIPKNLNIKDITQEELLKAYQDNGWQITKTNPQEISNYFKKLGYDGLRTPRETVIFDPKNIKTKSQLTDIWNKANFSRTEVPLSTQTMEAPSKILEKPQTVLPQVSQEVPQLSQELSSIEKITKALREVKPLRGKQERLYTEERAMRLAQLEKLRGTPQGEKTYLEQLGKLKGELGKVDYTPIREALTQPDVDNLFTHIDKSPILSTWDTINAKNGLVKIFDGKVPTNNEIGLLSRVFPKDFIDSVMANRSLWTKIKEGTLEVVNIPRAVMSSFDLSAPFRQGLFLINHPKRFFGAFNDMFKSFGSEKAFQELNEAIIRKPTFKVMQENKLALTDMNTFLNKREEQFMSSWAEKIPILGKGIKASGRAYTGFLNKLRADVFEDLYLKADKRGITKDRPEMVRELAKFINTATGRGSLEKTALGNLERSAVALNSFFFSPRLMASRLTLLNPLYYVKADPFVRKEAIKSLLTLAGVATTVLTLAKMGGAEVEDNPSSSDFGKIKINDTRVDILGGFQQYIVAAYRLASGKYTSTVSDETSKLGEGYKALSRYDIAMRQIESKEAPVISFITRLLKQKDASGKPVKASQEVIDLFTPMTIGALIDIAKEDPQLLPLSALGSFGFGMQTYENSKNMKASDFDFSSENTKPLKASDFKFD